MRLGTWARKEAPAGSRGPLKGEALARMRRMDYPTLMDWMDASVTRVGLLLRESTRADRPTTVVLEQALEETRALEQALLELLSRADQP